MNKLFPFFSLILVCLNTYGQDINLIKQLSYCGAISFAQGTWNEARGNTELGLTLKQGAFAFAKMTVVYGESEGYAENFLLDLNKSSLNSVKKEIEAGFFFDAKTLQNKNQNCLDLVGGNKKLLELWGKFFK